MRVSSVNVIQLDEAGEFKSIQSFTDDAEGNKEAETEFERIVRANSGEEAIHQEDISNSLDNGYFKGDEFEVIISHSEPAEAQSPDIQHKADLWDALLSSDRIRILGWAEIDGGHPHFGMEIWGDHPVKDSEYGNDIITRYAETVLKNREADKNGTTRDN
jgi:hypothetical protein